MAPRFHAAVVAIFLSFTMSGHAADFGHVECSVGSKMKPKQSCAFDASLGHGSSVPALRILEVRGYGRIREFHANSPRLAALMNTRRRQSCSILRRLRPTQSVLSISSLVSSFIACR